MASVPVLERTAYAAGIKTFREHSIKGGLVPNGPGAFIFHWNAVTQHGRAEQNTWESVTSSFGDAIRGQYPTLIAQYVGFSW